MVQPPFVRTGKELALHRRRAIKGHAAREAKRTDNAVREAKRTESLKRRASLPQNRTFECEDPADFCAQLLKDALNAVKDALVVVERVIQKNTPQDKPAVEQVLAYPGVASADQPFMQELFDNWDAQKIAHSVAEAALGRPAPGSWVWLTRVTAQSRAERSLVGQDSGVWAWTSSDAAKNADGATGSVRDKSAKGEATEAAPAMRGEQQGEPRSVKKDEPLGEPRQREQSAKKEEQQGEAKFREGRAAGRAETGAPQGEPRRARRRAS